VQETFHKNRERLKSERLARDAEGEGKVSEPNMLDPTPELPDDTPISNVEFPARICNVLAAAGLKTVGEVRETSDEILLSFQDLGKASVAYLRETLGLPSCDGVRL
jgi:DNA-directed RNA polymerase alpha subunit